MQSAKRTITEKDTPEKALDLSETLGSMREDQRQFDTKIAELIRKTHTIKEEGTKKKQWGLKVVEITKEVAMFWLYIIAGCLGTVVLLIIALYLIVKIRNSSTRSNFDIAYWYELCGFSVIPYNSIKWFSDIA